MGAHTVNGAGLESRLLLSLWAVAFRGLFGIGTALRMGSEEKSESTSGVCTSRGWVTPPGNPWP